MYTLRMVNKMAITVELVSEQKSIIKAFYMIVRMAEIVQYQEI